MLKIGKRILLLVIAEIIASYILKAIDNLENGLDAFGHEDKTKTRQDKKGNVVLGTNDYAVV